MYPDQPPPDDHRDEQLSRVADRLKRLQPRPLNLTPETVLRAAQPVRRTDVGWQRWLTIATSAAGGAVAGALLTMLLLGRDAQSTTNAPKAPDRIPASGTAADQVATDQQPSQERREPESMPGDSGPFDARRWTTAELLISNHLLEPHGVHSSTRQASPLRAGNALRQFATSFTTHDESLAVSDPESGPDGPSDDGITPTKSSATPTLERDQLLREILGAHRRSPL